MTTRHPKKIVGFEVVILAVFRYIRGGNRRFHGPGHHLVRRAKNSDGLGRVIVSV